jgi:predicted CXXCH cytochrome family protein
MRDVRAFILPLLLFSALLVSFAGPVSTANAQQKQAKMILSPGDCAKCHETQPADIEAAGTKHKSAVNCLDCHTNHRPASKNNIPVCSKCHQGKPHFEQKACLACHTNPHTPLKVTFKGPMTEPCLACHTNQIKQLRENKSKHSTKNCTDCHDVHRKVPQCTQCHKSHSADIAAVDCNKCHKAHMPKTVIYTSDVPSKFCAACHKPQFDKLASVKTKHTDQTCAACHLEKHKMVPNCKSCHGDKHPAGIMAKFPNCNVCHKSPHELNNWTPAPAPAGGAATAPKRPAKKRQ